MTHTYTAKTTGSIDNNRRKGRGDKIAQDVKALQEKYNWVIGLIIGVIVIISLDITGIVFNLVSNYDLNNKIGDVEKEIISIEERITKNLSDVSIIRGTLKDYSKKIEINNNILSCFSYKKYWQYQDCLGGQK
jgi:hypothetical protein